MGRPWVTLVTVIAAASCVSGSSPTLDFDPGRICTRIALEVRDPAVLPGWQVHAMAVERSDGERAWALATDDEDRLQLVAWPDGVTHDFSAIGASGELHLEPGPVEGETWVLLDRATEARAWMVSEDGGLLAGPLLADFPGPGNWTHRLVFVDHAAHILSVPAAGDADTVELLLSRLDDTLAPEPARRLPLWTACPEGQVEVSLHCDVVRPRGAIELEVVGTTMDGGTSATALIAIYRNLEAEPEVIGGQGTTVVSVELRPARPHEATEMIRRDLPGILSSVPVRVSTASIASDRRMLYWFVGLRPSSLETGDLGLRYLYAFRRSGLSREGRLLSMPAEFLRTQVLQVEGNAALGQIWGRIWSVAPIHERGVDVDAAGSLTLEPGARVSSAGRGQFLVHNVSGAAWRVGTSCDGD